MTDPLLRKKSSWKHSSNRSNRWSDDDTVRTHRHDEFDVSSTKKKKKQKMKLAIYADLSAMESLAMRLQASTVN